MIWKIPINYSVKLKIKKLRKLNMKSLNNELGSFWGTHHHVLFAKIIAKIFAFFANFLQEHDMENSD